MKKIIFVAAVALALCSCAKTELTGVEAGEMIIGASMEAYSSGTKAALADAGSFTWQTGDAIGVATSGGHANFSLKTGEGTNSATFSAVYSGTLGNYAVYPADIFVSDSKIKVPASRAWSEGNTNCSMFGSLIDGNVAFKHLGGVVKVTLNGVPVEAKKFVFSTPGKQITGEFDLETGTGTDTNKYIETSDDSGNANSSYTLSFTLDQAKNMAFYIPVPCGTYPKFAFKVLGANDAVLNEFEGSSQQVVNRKDILIMPTLTIGSITGEGEGAEQGAISKTVPAGTKGNYRLPAAEKVILNFEGDANPGDADVINLVYDGDSPLPSQLWLRVASGKKVNVSGDLQYTTVVFDQGDIAHASLTTAQNTFKIIAPAKISEKLVVKGGNVEISGEITGSDNVKAIEVVENATADGSSAPVQITIANKATIGASGQSDGGITTSADLVIVNNTETVVNVTVPDDVQNSVQVASAGTGTGEVKKDGETVTTKPAAAIGTQNFITLKDAINAIPEGNDQTVTINILEAIVLKASDVLTINKNNVVLDGKDHTISLDEKDTNLDKYKEDGTNKKYGSFQMIKVTGNDVVLRNLTLDSKDYRGVSLATTWGGKNATYQNIVYNGKGSGHYYGYAASEGTLTFTECTFNTCGYAIHTAESATDLVVTDCNINGWVSYGDKTKSATFANCKFYKAADKHNGTLATVRPYCSTTFTDCSFSSDYLTDSKYTGITVRHNVVVSLKNCTVDGSGNLYDLANITNPDDAWVDGGVLAINATGDATDGFTAGTFVAKQASDIKVKSGYACYAIEGKTNIYGIREVEAVAKIGSVKYETLAEAIAAAEAGDEVSIVKAGEYKVPNISKNITVKGDVEGVVFDCVGSGSIASIPNGCTFKNVSFKMGSSSYHGFQHAGTINMNDCTFEGLFFSYGNMNFTGCTFNQTQSEYCMWDYGQDLTYTNCTFNGAGKFINVYNEGNGNWKLTVEGCTFNSTAKNKAAINIKASCGAINLGWDVTINNCQVNDVTKFPEASGDATSALYVGSPIWQVDDRTTSSLEANIVKVTVDGVVVYGSEEAE